MSNRLWNQKLPPLFSLGSGFFNPAGARRLTSGWQIEMSSSGKAGFSFNPLLSSSKTQLKFYPLYSFSTERKAISRNHITDPVIKGFSWDWLDLACYPFEDLIVDILFWVPKPRILCADLRFKNLSDRSLEVDFDLVSELNPQDVSSKLEFGDYQGRSVISGSLEHTGIAFFSSGNPQRVKGPSPILRNQIAISKQGTYNLRWVCVLPVEDKKIQDDFDHILMMDWEGEIAYRKVRDQAAIQIWTGNEDWDFLLALSQKEATRKSQQILDTPLEAGTQSNINILQVLTYFQSHPILPSKTSAKLLDQIFSDQAEELNDPFPPIFVIELLWQLKKRREDPEIWRRHLARAVRLLESWFLQGMDQDGDGIPGLINPQIFDLLGQEELIEKKGGSEYLPYPYLESPGLATILANDLFKLMDLDPAAGRSFISQYLDVLLNFLDESWDPDLMGYQYRDSISHLTHPGEGVVASIKPGLNLLRLKLDSPSRIGFIRSESGTGGNVQTTYRIHIHGLDWKGEYRIEVLHSAGLNTKTIQERLLTESVYQRIDYCLLENGQSKFEIDLYIPGTIRDDITSILPFWLKTDQQVLSKTGVETILFDKDRFLTPFGLCSISGTESRTIQLTWNMISGHILLQAGRTKQAYDLFSSWMKAAKVNMNNAGGFYSAWNGISGKGFGIMNGLDSLLPIHLLLSLVGINLYQDGTIQIEEDYNLPAPITIKIMGYEITRESNHTSFTTPGGDIRSIPGGAEFHLFRG